MVVSHTIQGTLMVVTYHWAQYKYLGIMLFTMDNKMA